MKLGWISLVEGVTYYEDSLKDEWYLTYLMIALNRNAVNLVVL